MYYFKQKWAENGDVTQIPLEAQTDNTVSYEEGWTEEYELNPEEDVNAQILSRTNFNGLFSNITTVLQQFQQYGINPFITSADNGGTAFAYPIGGMCSYTDTTTNEYGIYYSLSANNTDAPSTGGVVSSNWWRIDKVQDYINQILSNLTGKADIDLNNCTKPYVTETYINGTSWYRIYSDGWCEQGGKTPMSQTTTVNLLKTYLDSDYNIVLGAYRNAFGNIYSPHIYSQTTNSFILGNENVSVGAYWQTSGYIS